jgi:predicted PurR-regulated permease PerM
MSDSEPTAARRETYIRWLMLIAIFLGLGVLSWFVAESLLVIFAGILVATVLDAAVRTIRLPIGRPWRLTIVVATILAALGAAVYWGGTRMIEEASALERTIEQQVAGLIETLRSLDLPFGLFEDGSDLGNLLPEASTLAGMAGFAFWTATDVLTTIVVIFLLGLFLAINPAAYRDGLLLLAPMHKRDRLREVMDEVGHKLQAWLVGQAVAMTVIGISVWGILAWAAVPSAIALGVVSGLLNFVPFLGPLIAAIPVGLVAVTQGTSTFLLVMGGFLIVQWLEGYLLTPFIQQKAVDLPPAHSLAFLTVMGALFGELGVALATPLLAVLRVLVLQLYVKDVLHDDAHA